MLFDAKKCFWVDEQNKICAYSDPCDEYLHPLGILYCAATKLDFGTMTVNAVISDSNFKLLSDSAKDFCVTHELGHIYNGDLNVNPNTIKRLHFKRLLGFVPKMEYKADYYAACAIGKHQVMRAMREMMSTKESTIITKIELFKRFIKIAFSGPRE